MVLRYAFWDCLNVSPYKSRNLIFLLQHAGHVCSLTLKMQREVQTTEVMETFASSRFVIPLKAIVSSCFTWATLASLFAM